MKQMKNRSHIELAHSEAIAEKADHVWHYDKKAAAFRAEKRAKLISNLALPVKKGVILEIGAGTGEYTKRYILGNAKLIATDISPSLIKAIQAKRIKNVSCKVANAEKLPFKSGFFDAVIGNSILHHLDLDEALDEIYRVLKKGGKMVFCEPNMMNPYLFIQKNSKFVKKITGDSPNETAFFRNELKKMLARHGFMRISIIPLDFIPPFLPDFLFGGFARKINTLLEQIPLFREFAGSLLIYCEK